MTFTWVSFSGSGGSDAGLSNWRPRFTPRLMSVGFMVAAVSLQRVSHRVLCFFPVSIQPSMLHFHSFITEPVQSQQIKSSLNNKQSKFWGSLNPQCCGNRVCFSRLMKHGKMDPIHSVYNPTHLPLIAFRRRTVFKQ